jgi:hypothetical protein
MATLVLFASLDRAGGHAAVVGLLVLIVVVAGLVYGLFQLVSRRRAGRTRSNRAAGSAEGPEA